MISVILFNVVYRVKKLFKQYIQFFSNSSLCSATSVARKYFTLNGEEKYSRFRKNIPPSVTGQIRSQHVAS